MLREDDDFVSSCGGDDRIGPVAAPKPGDADVVSRCPICSSAPGQISLGDQRLCSKCFASKVQSHVHYALGEVFSSHKLNRTVVLAFSGNFGSFATTSGVASWHRSRSEGIARFIQGQLARFDSEDAEKARSSRLAGWAAEDVALLRRYLATRSSQSHDSASSVDSKSSTKVDVTLLPVLSVPSRLIRALRPPARLSLPPRVALLHVDCTAIDAIVRGPRGRASEGALRGGASRGEVSVRQAAEHARQAAGGIGPALRLFQCRLEDVFLPAVPGHHDVAMGERMGRASGTGSRVSRYIMPLVELEWGGKTEVGGQGQQAAGAGASSKAAGETLPAASSASIDSRGDVRARSPRSESRVLALHALLGSLGHADAQERMLRVLHGIALRRAALAVDALLRGEEACGDEDEDGRRGESRKAAAEYHGGGGGSVPSAGYAPAHAHAPLPVLVLSTNGDKAAELTMTSLAEGTGYGVAEGSKVLDARHCGADATAAGGAPGPLLLRPLLGLGRLDLEAYGRLCEFEPVPKQRTFLANLRRPRSSVAQVAAKFVRTLQDGFVSTRHAVRRTMDKLKEPPLLVTQEGLGSAAESGVTSEGPVLCPLCGEFQSPFDSELSKQSGESFRAGTAEGPPSGSAALLRGASLSLLPVCCHACRVMLREAGHASAGELSRVGHYGARSVAVTSARGTRVGEAAVDGGSGALGDGVTSDSSVASLLPPSVRAGVVLGWAAVSEGVSSGVASVTSARCEGTSGSAESGRDGSGGGKGFAGAGGRGPSSAWTRQQMLASIGEFLLDDDGGAAGGGKTGS